MSEKSKIVVIEVEGGLVQDVKNIPIEDYIVINYDVPEDKDLWDEDDVCLGCEYHKKPATHG